MNLVAEGLDNHWYGPIDEIQGIVGEDGLFQSLEDYKPISLGSLSSRASDMPPGVITPFSGQIIVDFMCQIALSGKFNVTKYKIGTQGIKGFAGPSKIWVWTWANGMYLVRSD